MGLITGAAEFALGNPLQTTLKMGATGFSTWGRVLEKLSQGDLGGAAESYIGGVEEQVDNLVVHTEHQLDSAAKMVGGGAGLLVQPAASWLQVAGNSLSTWGRVGGSRRRRRLS